MKTIINLITILSLLAVAGFFFMFSNQGSSTDKHPVVSQTNDTATTSPVKIIAFGDSLTAGYGLPLADSYPSQLEKKLQADGFSVEVINSGVSGETSASNEQRAQFIRNQNPDIIILGIGGNDALRFLPVSDTYQNIKDTLSILQAGTNPPQVILLSIQAPINVGLVYKKSFDDMYPKLAKEFNLQLTPFIVEEVSRNPDLLQADGIHPKKEGYTILVDKYILPEVESMLTK